MHALAYSVTSLKMKFKSGGGWRESGGKWRSNKHGITTDLRVISASLEELFMICLGSHCTSGP
jgi:hypothetical protein